LKRVKTYNNGSVTLSFTEPLLFPLNFENVPFNSLIELSVVQPWEMQGDNEEREIEVIYDYSRPARALKP